MTLQVYRLRRWLAALAVLFTLVVAGMYLSARLRQHSFLKDVPGKIGIDIKQTAKGFQFSKSDGGRTLFTIEASNLKQFRFDGRAELHDVKIVLYGRDSSRFDQITGDNFNYDPKTGDVSANGDVQIDLGTNPEGSKSADQARPAQPSHPIHLKTRDLVFNRESGNAITKAKVEFETPQASGSAVGMMYAGKANSLILDSDIALVLAGEDSVAGDSGTIHASHAVVTSDPKQISMSQPSLKRDGEWLKAEEATIALDQDNNVQHVFAHGDVTAQAQEKSKKPKEARNLGPNGRHATTEAPAQPSLLEARADEGEIRLGEQNRIQVAMLTGHVQMEKTGTQPIQGTAGRVALDFSPENEIRVVHALQGVRLLQKAGDKTDDSAQANPSSAQNFELTSPEVDFVVADGSVLERAVTFGKSQIKIVDFANAAAKNTESKTKIPTPKEKLPQSTIIRAGKFEAKFAGNTDGENRLTSIHGAPEATIVSSNPGQPDRVSTSDAVDADFLPEGGIAAVTQEGHIVYNDGLPAEKQTKAWAERARYTPGNETLLLTGSPRVEQGSTETTAATLRINRATGDAFADGDVKSTYNQLQENPQGALLASSSPIHVTAASMIAHSKPSIATYSGNARLWQDANIIQSPSIVFDRDRRCVTAEGSAKRPVQTTLVQKDEHKQEKDLQVKQRSSDASSLKPIFVTGTRLTYSDSNRIAHYEGGVTVRATDFTAFAKQMDLYLKPHSESFNPLSAKGTKKSPQSGQGPAQLDKMIAQNDVVIQQTGRRALGETLLYQADEDKFTLSGGPPSIFDAEHGKITGDSLTFFRRDDRVLVEGKSSSPVVTQTRVAR